MKLITLFFEWLFYQNDKVQNECIEVSNTFLAPNPANIKNTERILKWLTECDCYYTLLTYLNYARENKADILVLTQIENRISDYLNSLDPTIRYFLLDYK